MHIRFSSNVFFETPASSSLFNCSSFLHFSLFLGPPSSYKSQKNGYQRTSNPKWQIVLNLYKNHTAPQYMSRNEAC